jgi:hypothetical protein
MTHTNQYRDYDSLAPKHDSTAKLRSKFSQPPIDAMAKAGLIDHDSRVYLVKKYRTQFASGTGSVISILAGVCPPWAQRFEWTMDADGQVVSPGEHQNANAVVSKAHTWDV